MVNETTSVNETASVAVAVSKAATETHLPPLLFILDSSHPWLPSMLD